MNIENQYSDDEFIALMSGVLSDVPDDEEPVNLDAERNNPVISWEEFAGNYQ